MGLAVAAPVGPIGILCIRRTLNEGRVAGMASGLGAAVADATYGAMVAGSLVATGLLLSYAGALQVGGGLLIALLGGLSVRAFYTKNNLGTHEQPANSSGWFRAFATTFALTLSNPLTILVFVGLVAGLGASSGSGPFAPYWLVLGIFVGSCLWWLFLVQAVLVAKNRLTSSMLRWVDLVSGGVLIVWGVWIMAGAWSARADILP